MPRSFFVDGEVRVSSDRALRQVRRFVKRAESRKINLAINDRKFTQPLGRITGAASEFNKSLEASNARVLAFGASAGVLYGLTRAFGMMVSQTIKVEKGLADINVILNVTSKNLVKFGDKLFHIAGKTGQAFDEVSKAAVELARQGLGVAETLKRTENAMILMRLSGMNAVEAVESLTAAMNSFQAITLDTTQIVNKMAKIDAAFAVSTADLANAIKRVGASAEDAGVDLDKLMAATTALQQTTARGGAVIGNSLKTIFTRIKRTQVINQLKDLGVNVKNASGEIRPAMTVLKEFAKTFDTLTASEKAHMTELMGGVFQMNILRALLKDLKKDFSFYDQALQASTSAVDEAIDRNKELNKTLSAMVNQSLQQLTKLGVALGELTVAPAIKKLLKEFDSMMQGGGTMKGIAVAIAPEVDWKAVDDVAKKVGKGFLEGIGRFLEGPGIFLLTTVLAKLLFKFTFFIKDAGMGFFKLNQKAAEHAAIQKQIQTMLAANPELLARIYSGDTKIVAAEKEILMLLRQQAKERERLRMLAGGMAGGLMGRGVVMHSDKAAQTRQLGIGANRSFTPTPFGRGRAQGFVPSRVERASEIQNASRGGYDVRPRDVVKKKLPGMSGPTVFNKHEQVRMIGGKPLISPPKGTAAAAGHKQESMRKLGIDPYALAADGFIPSFAAKRGRPIINTPAAIAKKVKAGRRSNLTTVQPVTQLQAMRDASVAIEKAGHVPLITWKGETRGVNKKTGYGSPPRPFESTGVLMSSKHAVYERTGGAGGKAASARNKNAQTLMIQKGAVQGGKFVPDGDPSSGIRALPADKIHSWQYNIKGYGNATHVKSPTKQGQARGYVPNFGTSPRTVAYASNAERSLGITGSEAKGAIRYPSVGGANVNLFLDDFQNEMMHYKNSAGMFENAGGIKRAAETRLKRAMEAGNISASQRTTIQGQMEAIAPKAKMITGTKQKRKTKKEDSGKQRQKNTVDTNYWMLTSEQGQAQQRAASSTMLGKGNTGGVRLGYHLTGWKDQGKGKDFKALLKKHLDPAFRKMYKSMFGGLKIGSKPTRIDQLSQYAGTESLSGTLFDGMVKDAIVRSTAAKNDITKHKLDIMNVGNESVMKLFNTKGAAPGHRGDLKLHAAKQGSGFAAQILDDLAFEYRAGGSAGIADRLHGMAPVAAQKLLTKGDPLRFPDPTEKAGKKGKGKAGGYVPNFAVLPGGGGFGGAVGKGFGRQMFGGKPSLNQWATFKKDPRAYRKILDQSMNELTAGEWLRPTSKYMSSPFATGLHEPQNLSQYYTSTMGKGSKSGIWERLMSQVVNGSKLGSLIKQSQSAAQGILSFGKLAVMRGENPFTPHGGINQLNYAKSDAGRNFAGGHVPNFAMTPTSRGAMTAQRMGNPFQKYSKKEIADAFRYGKPGSQGSEGGLRWDRGHKIHAQRREELLAYGQMQGRGWMGVVKNVGMKAMEMFGAGGHVPSFARGPGGRPNIPSVPPFPTTKGSGILPGMPKAFPLPAGLMMPTSGQKVRIGLGEKGTIGGGRLEGLTGHIAKASSTLTDDMLKNGEALVRLTSGKTVIVKIRNLEPENQLGGPASGGRFPTPGLKYNDGTGKHRDPYHSSLPFGGYAGGGYVPNFSKFTPRSLTAPITLSKPEYGKVGSAKRGESHRTGMIRSMLQGEQVGYLKYTYGRGTGAGGARPGQSRNVSLGYNQADPSVRGQGIGFKQIQAFSKMMGSREWGSSIKLQTSSMEGSNKFQSILATHMAQTSNYAALVGPKGFPQIRHRQMDGHTTRGRVSVGENTITGGYIDQPFANLSELKALVNKIDPKLFRTALAEGDIEFGRLFTKNLGAGSLGGMAAGGHVPNFSALGDAFTREQAASGLPRSQIYSANVAGLGKVVANRRDEPSRGALLKNVRSHPAPAFAGMVPSYAVNPLGTGPTGGAAALAFKAMQHSQIMQRGIPTAGPMGGMSFPKSNIAPLLTSLKALSAHIKLMTGAGTGASLVLKPLVAEMARHTQQFRQSHTSMTQVLTVATKEAYAMTTPMAQLKQQLLAVGKAAGVSAARMKPLLASVAASGPGRLPTGQWAMSGGTPRALAAGAMQRQIAPGGIAGGVTSPLAMGNAAWQTQAMNRAGVTGQANQAALAKMGMTPKYTGAGLMMSDKQMTSMGKGAMAATQKLMIVNAHIASMEAAMRKGAAFTPKMAVELGKLMSGLNISSSIQQKIAKHMVGRDSQYATIYAAEKELLKTQVLINAAAKKELSKRLSGAIAPNPYAMGTKGTGMGGLTNALNKAQNQMPRMMTEAGKTIGGGAITNTQSARLGTLMAGQQNVRAQPLTTAIKHFSPTGGFTHKQMQSSFGSSGAMGATGGHVLQRQLIEKSANMTQKEINQKALTSKELAKINMFYLRIERGLMKGKALTDETVMAFQRNLQAVGRNLNKEHGIGTSLGIEDATIKQIITQLRTRAGIIGAEVMVQKEILMTEEQELIEERKRLAQEKQGNLQEAELNTIQKLQLQTEQGIYAALKRRLSMESIRSGSVFGPTVGTQLAGFAAKGGQTGAAAIAAQQQIKGAGWAGQKGMMAAMTMSMLAPMVTSSIAQFQTDKVKKAKTQGWGDVAMYGGMGMFFGKWGAMAGLAIGAGMGLTKVFKAMIDDSESLNEEYERANEKMTRFNDGISSLIQATDQLNTGMLDPDISGKELVARERLQAKAFEKIPDEWRDDIMGASGNRDELTTLVSLIQKDTAQIVAIAKLRKDLEAAQQQTRGFWNTLSQGEGIGGAIRNITGSDSAITGILKELAIGGALALLASTGVGTAGAGVIAAARYGNMARKGAQAGLAMGKVTKVTRAAHVARTSKRALNTGIRGGYLTKGRVLMGAGAATVLGGATGIGRTKGDAGMLQSVIGRGENEFGTMMGGIWSGDKDVIRELAKKYQGAMFTDTPAGKIKLDMVVRGFKQNLQTLEWFRNQTQTQIDSFTSKAAALGDSDWKGLVTIFKDMGLQEEGLEAMTEFFKGREGGYGLKDGGFKDIPKLMHELLEIFPEGDIAANQLRIYQDIIANNRDMRDKLIRVEREVGDAIRSLGLTIEREVGSMVSTLITRDQSLGAINQGRRGYALEFSKGVAEINKPFTTLESEADSKSDIARGELQAKMVNSFRKTQGKGRASILNTFQKSMQGFFNNLSKIYREQETKGESPEQRRTEIKKLTDQRDAILRLFNEVSRTFAEDEMAGPEQITPLLEELRGLDIFTGNTQLIEGLITSVENVGDRNAAELQKILVQHRIQTQILQLQTDIQREQIALEKRLGSFGGIERYKSGEMLDTSDLMRKFLTSQYSPALSRGAMTMGSKGNEMWVGGGQPTGSRMGTIHQGRASLEMLNMFKGNMPGNISDWVRGGSREGTSMAPFIDSAIKGRVAMMQRDMGQMNSLFQMLTGAPAHKLGGEFHPPGPLGKRPQPHLQRLMGDSGATEEMNQIAREQIATELELEDVAGNVLGIKKGIDTLNRLNRFEMSQFEDKNKQAFKQAMHEVGLIESIEGTTSEVASHARFEGGKLDLIAQLLEAQRQIAEKQKVVNKAIKDQGRAFAEEGQFKAKIKKAEVLKKPFDKEVEKFKDLDAIQKVERRAAIVHAAKQFGIGVPGVGSDLTKKQIETLEQKHGAGFTQIAKHGWQPQGQDAAGDKRGDQLVRALSGMAIGNYLKRRMKEGGRGVPGGNMDNLLRGFYDPKSGSGLVNAQMIDKYSEGRGDTDPKGTVMADLWKKAFWTGAGGPGGGPGRKRTIEEIDWDAFGELSGRAYSIVQEYDGFARYKQRMEGSLNNEQWKEPAIKELITGMMTPDFLKGDLFNKLKDELGLVGAENEMMNPFYTYNYTGKRRGGRLARPNEQVGAAVTKNLMGGSYDPQLPISTTTAWWSELQRLQLQVQENPDEVEDKVKARIAALKNLIGPAAGGDSKAQEKRGLLMVQQHQMGIFARQKEERDARDRAEREQKVHGNMLGDIAVKLKEATERLIIADRELKAAEDELIKLPTAGDIRKTAFGKAQARYASKRAAHNERRKALQELELNQRAREVPFRNIGRNLLAQDKFNLSPLLPGPGQAKGRGIPQVAEALKPLIPELKKALGEKLTWGHGDASSNRKALDIMTKRVGSARKEVKDAQTKIDGVREQIRMAREGLTLEPGELEFAMPGFKEEIKTQLNIIDSNQKLINGLKAVTDALKVNLGAGDISKRLPAQSWAGPQFGQMALFHARQGQGQYQNFMGGVARQREDYLLMQQGGIAGKDADARRISLEAMQKKHEEDRVARIAKAQEALDYAKKGKAWMEGTGNIPGRWASIGPDPLVKTSNITAMQKNLAAAKATPEIIAEKAAYEAQLRGDAPLQRVRNLQGMQVNQIKPGMIAQHIDEGLVEQNKVTNAALQSNYDIITHQTYAFAEEIAKAADELTQNNIRFKNYGMKDFIRTIRKELTYQSQDLYGDLDRLGGNVTRRLKTGLGDVFYEALDGTKSLKEGFKDLFDEIANMITRAIIQMAVNQFIFAPAGLNVGTGKKGGLAQKLATGGPVIGGSGQKDDIPAMLNRGEFVIRKASVDKYGTDFLMALNRGQAQGRAAGGSTDSKPKPPTNLSNSDLEEIAEIASTKDPQAGLSSTRINTPHSTRSNLRNAFVYDDDKYPTIGGSKFALDPRLSRRALWDEDNPRNQFRMDKQSKLYDYHIAREQELARWREAVKEWEEQKKNRRKKAWTTFALALALGTGQTRTNPQTGQEESVPLFSGNIKQNYGYKLGKGLMGAPGRMFKALGQGAQKIFAAGGGEPNAQGGMAADTIPALLMGGEYVISKDAVARHGVSFFEKLNQGSLPKYQDGGYVGNSSGSSGYSGQSQDIANNINITVNVASGGEGSTDEKIDYGSYDKERDDANSMGELIKNVVVKTIVEQTRQGGILAPMQRIS